MTYFLVGDLHLTDRPRDAYRFDIFSWLIKQQEKYQPTVTILLGDITDLKDNHSSALVNRIVTNLSNLHDPVYVLMGNHDYIDPSSPFFAFLNHMHGVTFVNQPCVAFDVAFLPHCRAEQQFEASYRALAARKPRMVVCHASIEGAVAESGARLSGFRASLVDCYRPPLGVYGGDVHRPQRCGPVTYVGAPYQIRFGDDFEPRCLLVSDQGEKELYFDTVRKWQLTVSGPREITDNTHLLAHDQVKITVELPPEQLVHWQDHRSQVLEAATKMGLEVLGIDLTILPVERKAAILPRKATASPGEILTAFCKHETVPTDIRDVGRALLDE